MRRQEMAVNPKSEIRKKKIRIPDFADMKISTPAQMVAALGGEMRIVVKLEDKELAITEPGRKSVRRGGCLIISVSPIGVRGS